MVALLFVIVVTVWFTVCLRCLLWLLFCLVVGGVLIELSLCWRLSCFRACWLVVVLLGALLVVDLLACILLRLCFAGACCG